MSKRILVIGLLVFAISLAMVGTSFAAVSVSDVYNNASGVPDKVFVTGLAAGDTVKIYPSPTSTVVVLGSATAKAVTGGVYSATVTVKQLIPNTSTAPKTLYVGVIAKDATTGTFPRTSFSVALETPTNIASVSSSVPTIVNNGLGVLDTVYITGLLAGDVVKLYDDNTATKVLLATGTASKTGALTLKHKELDGLTLYFTVTRTKPLTGASTSESIGFKGPFVVPAQVLTKLVNAAPSAVDEVYAKNITIVNNYSVADTVYIYGFLAGDVVKLYKSATVSQANLLAKATASTVKGAAYSGVTLKVKQLNATAGSVNVYFTVTRTKPTSGPSLAESAVSAAQSVPAEGKATLNAGQISVVNNKASADKVTVTGLIVGDIVKVYASDFDETVIGKATVTTGTTQAVVSIAQLGAGADDVYVTVTRMKPTSGATLGESDRVAKSYIAEP